MSDFYNRTSNQIKSDTLKIINKDFKCCKLLEYDHRTILLENLTKNKNIIKYILLNLYPENNEIKYKTTYYYKLDEALEDYHNS